jgi:hypothetical protein
MALLATSLSPAGVVIVGCSGHRMCTRRIRPLILSSHSPATGHDELSIVASSLGGWRRRATQRVLLSLKSFAKCGGSFARLGSSS